ncbi:prepilin peptidase [Amnibacterium sp.]|uniref:prepilin peptidase n=1 Tax=Amnibacterium sp. TaxID=1872496 RepID=UPI003F7BD1F7
MLAVARRVPLPEAVPALALLALAVLAVGPEPALLGLAWLALVTPRLVAVDLAEHRLPDAIVLPGYPIVLLTAVLHAWVSPASLWPLLTAGAACGLVFLLLHTAGGMGFGDVKLAPLLGALAAMTVPGGAPLWIVLAFATGGIGAVAVLARRGLGARMPFGPPMLLAAWAVVALA